MSKSEVIQFRVSRDELEEIDRLANKENKSRTDFIRARLIGEDQKNLVVQTEKRLTDVSVELPKVVKPKIKKIIIKLGIPKKQKIITKLVLEKYSDVSWECYFHWIIIQISTVSGITYEEYIRDHLKYMKKLPKNEDIFRNFPFMGKYEAEYVCDILTDNWIRKIAHYDEFIAKIKERSFKQIDEELKRNISKQS